MAELLGVVASGAGLVSLAVQLGEGAVKIKHLCNSYREAPKHLQDLSEDLETMARILRLLEIDCQQAHGIDRTVIDRCVSSCRRVAAELSTVVNKFEAAMKKSNTKGRVRTAFGQTSITQLCDSLERAKSSLILAFSLCRESARHSDSDRLNQLTAYFVHQERANNLIQEQLCRNTTALQQLRLSGLSPVLKDERRSSQGCTQQFTSPVHTRGQTASNSVQRAQGKDRDMRRRHDSRQTRRIRLSPWFTTRVWEISFVVAQSGFDFALRTCNFVPDDALIFEVCEGGNIAEVQALFQSGEASPFDCSCSPLWWPSEKTVLAAAAASGNLQLCQFLVKIAGFPATPSHFDDPLSAYARSGLGISNKYTKDAVDMYRLLSEQPGWDVDPLITGEIGGVEVDCPWWWACPDSACVKLVRDEYSPTFSALSWEAQFQVAIDNSGFRRETMPEVFLSMLGCNAVNSYVAKACDSHGRTTLHLVAGQLSKIRGDVYCTWIDFVTQLLICGAEIHQRDNGGDTAFTYLLRHSPPSRVSTYVRAWAELLKAAGVELMGYGQSEKTMWSALNPFGRPGCRYRIGAWTHGASVDDWTVDIFYEKIILIYKMVSTPGAWPANNQYLIKTICWNPMEEDRINVSDSLMGSWHRSKAEDVTLYLSSSLDKRESFQQDSIFDISAHYASELNRTQDDCRIITRLIQNSSRAYNRPRSCSQPVRNTSRHVRYYGRRWLPWCHICLEDGRCKFLSSGETWPEHRRCARHCCDGNGRDRRDYQKRIAQQIRRFKTRYRDVAELRSLPYAAYHPTWKTNSSPVLEGL